MRNTDTLTIKDVLTSSGVLKHVVVPPEISTLLEALEPKGDPEVRGPGITIGEVILNGNIAKSPIPGFNLALQLPTEPVEPAPYKLLLEPPEAPTKFSFWLVLAEQGQIRALLKPVQDLPGLALGAARIEQEHGLTKLVRIDGTTPVLVSRSEEGGAALGPALLITGSAAVPARLRFTPDTDSTEGIVALGFEPQTVVFGDTGIGFTCPALVLDDSESAKGPGQGAPGLDPPLAEIDADTLTWRGIFAREVVFYLPASVPFVGGRPIRGYFEQSAEGGPKVVIETKIPETPATGGFPARPGFSVRIECLDPTARGLAGLVPTLIAATVEVPDGPAEMPIDNGTVSFLRGKDLKLTATLMRDPVSAPGEFRIAVAVTAQGGEGLISVHSDNGLSPAKFFNVAAAVSTALIADSKASAQSKLSAFAAAGAALSALFEDDTSFVLHAVEVESAGHGLPVGGKVSMRLDYTVQARVVQLGLGGLSVSMKRDMPMRIRVRGLVASVDPASSGAAMIDLDFDRAELEVENPGAWDVTGLDRLFDVLASRSGRGSGWVEVDLRFKMNLGPIEVTDLTLRASFNGGPSPIVSLRGMGARLQVPGVLDGAGSLHIVEGGFSASIAAGIVPLRLTAEAGLSTGGGRTLLHLGVELPAPIPFANSGFGLFAVGGLFAVPAVPDFGAETDPILCQLAWNPRDPAGYRTLDGQMTVGLDAVVGTLPDFGFTLSAKAGLILTIPDVSVRAALNGRVMTTPAKLADSNLPPPGLSFLGLVNIDSEALTFALIGRLELLPLLKVTVPLVGHYPLKERAADWFTYLGTDGSPVQGRSVGPISASVLPGILDIGADAYFMVRGQGIADWPHGRPTPNGPLTLADGFVIAFGFGLQSKFGVEPIAWVELYASLDLLIGAKPPTLSGFGRAGGSLNLGPFSLGVEAQLAFFAQNDIRYLWCQVTGKIELVFFDIEATVTISFGNDDLKPTLPPPDRHPLDREAAPEAPWRSTAVLTDDSYRVVAPLFEAPDEIGSAVVWPDVMISIPFAAMPVVEAGAAIQFPGVMTAPPAASRIGTEMLWYEWHLRSLRLVVVTAADPFAAGTPVGEGATLSARWQVGRVGGDDVAELLLFSTAGGLWMNRRTDTDDLPGDPLGESIDFCTIEVPPAPGWAIGATASPAGPGFRLPPDRILRSPIASRVEAQMRHYAVGETMMQLDEGRTVPVNYEIAAASTIDWDRPATLEDHDFIGHIVSPRLDRIGLADFHVRFDFRGQAQVFRTTASLGEGVLIVAVRREEFDALRDRRIRTDQDRFDESAGGNILSPVQSIEWQIEETGEVVGDGWTVFRFRQPYGVQTQSLRIVYPVGLNLAVIGLGGVTATAREAASRREAGLRALNTIMTTAAAGGPPLHCGAYAEYQRAILQPDTLYRLDVDLTWTGQLYAQDTSGARVASGDLVTGNSYRRAGQDVPCLRQLFFRTAPRPAGTPLHRASPKFATWLMLQQDVFEPEMIERYLAGYEPAQSEAFRFTSDPLRVHFRQSHVAALADAYGFTLSLALRRTDRAGGGDDNSPSILDLVWGWATSKDFLSPMDQVRFDRIHTSPCAQPLPGATGTASAPLAPEAWYELYVIAKPTGDGTTRSGRLPGVTFRTSRWHDAADMLAGLGFDTGGTPQGLVGDLEVDWSAFPAGPVASDAGFADALQRIGLEGWPSPEQPRLSRLWTVDQEGGWACAGLMVESVEPIVRTGRLDLLPLSLDGPGPAFSRKTQDGGGFRFLLLADQPFAPAEGTRYVFSVQDAGGGAVVQGRLDLPTRPFFAEDPR